MYRMPAKGDNSAAALKATQEAVWSNDLPEILVSAGQW
jgi:hypothetical protein